MPYIDEERRKAVKNNVQTVSDVGELNYLVTEYIKACWKKDRHYSTIHALYKEMFLRPEKSRLLDFLKRRTAQEYTSTDIHVAGQLAFFEFYRREVGKYEDEKIKNNGDVYNEEK